MYSPSVTDPIRPLLFFSFPMQINIYEDPRKNGMTPFTCRHFFEGGVSLLCLQRVRSGWCFAYICPRGCGCYFWLLLLRHSDLFPSFLPFSFFKFDSVPIRPFPHGEHGGYPFFFFLKNFADTMDKWDQAKLEQVVKSKEHKTNETKIVRTIDRLID